MNDEQYKYLLSELANIKEGLQNLEEAVAFVKNNLPDNFVDLRISNDGAVEEVQVVCDDLEYP